jgi:hypothetical protein
MAWTPCISGSVILVLAHNIENKGGLRNVVYSLWSIRGSDVCIALMRLISPRLGGGGFHARLPSSPLILHCLVSCIDAWSLSTQVDSKTLVLTTSNSYSGSRPDENH